MLLIKKDRKYQAILIIAAIVLAWAALHKPSTNLQPKGFKKPSNVRTGAPGAEETVNDLITAFRGDVNTLKSEVSTLKNNHEVEKKETEEANARFAEILKTVLTRMEEKTSVDRAAAAGQSAVNPVAPTETVEDPGDPNAPIASIGGSDGAAIEEFRPVHTSIVAPPPPPSQQRVAIVGIGDHVRVKLIAAVHANTDGTPYPVLFKVLSDIRGPNDSNLPVGEALLVAAAQGSLTDSRALFRLTSLNMAYPDGRRNVIDVDGWVVGEDGIAGLEGVLIDPIGKAIAATGMGGLLQGVGEGLQARNVTNTSSMFGGSTVELTGDEREYALGRGLSESAKAWSRIVESRVAKIQPVVEVLSEREATAIFSKSFKIPGLIEAYQVNEENYSSVD